MIRKGLIPIAGLATRMYPLTKVAPKAMLPLPAPDKRPVPVVHWICAEAAAGGIEHVLLIVAPQHEVMIRAYFAAGHDPELPKLPDTIELIVQPTPKGFGDAVLRGADFIHGEPFLLLLGDHVYLTESQVSHCAAQLVEAFARLGGHAMVGMRHVAAEQLPNVGVARGEPIEDRVYRCTDLIEKPDLHTARNRLLTPGLAEGTFLAHAGLYVLDGEVFDCLTEISRNPGHHGELQLTDALAMLLQRYPKGYFLYTIDGQSYDAGSPCGYAEAFTAFTHL